MGYGGHGCGVDVHSQTTTKTSTAQPQVPDHNRVDQILFDCLQPTTSTKNK